MAKRRGYSPEQIITKLREAEVLLSQGKTVAQACKAIEVSEQTYYRWRKEYGSMTVNQAKQLKEMEKENARLKKLVADLSLDNAILKEVLGKKIIADASIGTRQEAEGRPASHRSPGCLRAQSLSGAGTTQIHAAVSQTDSG